MSAYKVVNRRIRIGLSDATAERERSMQQLVDEGAARGWRLLSFQSAPSGNALDVVLVWEVGDRRIPPPPG